MAWLKNEFANLVPIFLYFFIFFLLISWIETYLFEEMGLSPFRFAQVFIAAALIAKIFIVIDHVPFVHMFNNMPLVYSVLWKTGLYWVLLFIVRLAIRGVPYFFHKEGNLEIGIHQFFQGLNWHLFVSIQVYYLMLIFNFVSIRELARKIGADKIKELFFGIKR